MPALRHNGAMPTLLAPLQAQVLQYCVAPGQAFGAGQVLLIVEAMKMEHELRAEAAGSMGAQFCAVGELVQAGDALLNWELSTHNSCASQAESTLKTIVKTSPDAPVQLPQRADLAALQARLALTHDAARPEAMAKRHAQGQRSAREIVALLCDLAAHPERFNEYGALAVAAQSRRRSAQDLAANTPADGMVTGIGCVNAEAFGTVASQVAVLAYDATVLAGTQGMRNHQKTDRLLAIALRNKLPVVLWAEGGGGRPGDVDMPIVAGLHVGSFASFARLNGQVPVVGVVSGRCFAGNAALLGCCDVIIATHKSNIGMGGPAMVEGGGLGVFTPEQIGPSSLQHANGVIDVLVGDDAQAVEAAQHYLSFFQGRVKEWQAPDAQALRHVVPENRLRVYDTRAAMQGIADVGSLLELRSGFGLGIHTALVRIEGRAVGLLANNPLHLSGAIDAAAADKAARFMQLCNAHGLPLISLVDTPGFMVGPAVEETAQVRHVSRMFIAAAHLRVPVLSVVLRKAYGLGAMAMVAGGFHESDATVAWPSAEFGAMGLEGAVRLGFRKELEAVPEGAQREALYAQLVAQQYAAGSATNMAQTLEIDAVIDPAETRAWLARGLQAGKPREGAAVRAIDAW